MTTPESYLGAGRAVRFANGSIAAGTQDFTASAGEVPHDGLAYEGRWRIGFDDATAVSDARLDLNFGARRVFLVLGSRGGKPRPLRVLLDGKPLPHALRRHRRPRRGGDDRRPAALPPGRTAERPAPPPHARIRPRRSPATPSPSDEPRRWDNGAHGRPEARRTVLVVDDEPTIGEVVSRYLERAGYETATAADGLEAMRLADASSAPTSSSST